MTVHWKKAGTLIEICSYCTSKVALLPFYVSSTDKAMKYLWHVQEQTQTPGRKPRLFKFQLVPKSPGSTPGRATVQTGICVYLNFYHQFMCKGTSLVHRMASPAQSKKSSNIFLSLQHCLILCLLTSLAISRGKWLGRIPPCSPNPQNSWTDFIFNLIK